MKLWRRPTARYTRPSRQDETRWHQPALRKSIPLPDKEIQGDMSSTTVAAISGKITARIASIHIDPACNSFLNDCFRQFGIMVVPADDDPVMLLNRQKFEACV